MGEGYRPLYRLLAMVQSEDEGVAFVHLKTIRNSEGCDLPEGYASMI